MSRAESAAKTRQIMRVKYHESELETMKQRVFAYQGGFARGRCRGRFRHAGFRSDGFFGCASGSLDCFEQNALLAAVLETIGFRVRRLAARVRMGAVKIQPRSHMLLAVEANGESWLADAGFGGEGLLLPVRLKPGEVERHFAWQYRVSVDGGLHVLQSWRPEGWFDLYSFTLEEQHPADYEVSNYFTSTNPHSPFVNRLVVQRPGKEVRLTLANRLLREQRPEGVSETILADDDALLETLAERFGLRFPAGTRFAYKETPPGPG